MTHVLTNQYQTRPNITKYSCFCSGCAKLSQLLPCCSVITVLSVSVRVCVCQPLRSCTLYIFYIEILFSLFSGFLFDLYHKYLTSRPGLTVVSSSCPRDGQLVYSRALTTVFNNLSLNAKSTNTIQRSISSCAHLLQAVTYGYRHSEGGSLGLP